MKQNFPFLKYVLFIGSGMVSGGSAYQESYLFKTIGEILEKENVPTLNIAGEEESWLVLAHKYRENGAFVKNSEIDFSKQADPGFLSSEIWASKIKDKKDFSQDAEIAKSLREACLDSLGKKFTTDLYKKVLVGCRLDLPEKIKKFLKLQKDSGGCRFGITRSSADKSGQYVGEGSEFKEFWHENKYLDILGEFLTKEQSKEQILSLCKEKKDKVLRLFGVNSNTRTRTGQENTVIKDSDNLKSFLSRVLVEQ